MCFYTLTRNYIKKEMENNPIYSSIKNKQKILINKFNQRGKIYFLNNNLGEKNLNFC